MKKAPNLIDTVRENLELRRISRKRRSALLPRQAPPVKTKQIQRKILLTDADSHC
jgi:hypothetical protein